MTTMTTMTTTEPLHLTDLIFEDQRIRQSRALNPYRDVLDYSLPTTTRFNPSRIMFHRTRIVRIERTLQEKIAFANKRREDQAQADTAICEAFASSKDVNECAITLMPLTHWSQVAVTLPCRHLFEWNALQQWTNGTCPLCRSFYTPYLRSVPLYKSVAYEKLVLYYLLKKIDKQRLMDVVSTRKCHQLTVMATKASSCVHQEPSCLLHQERRQLRIIAMWLLRLMKLLLLILR